MFVYDLPNNFLIATDISSSFVFKSVQYVSVPLLCRSKEAEKAEVENRKVKEKKKSSAKALTTCF